MAATLPPELLAILTPAASLPTPLPPDPFPIFIEWFQQQAAQPSQPNPSCMYLATIGLGGSPRCRAVLCRGIDPVGYLVFYTNYDGDKGRELAANPRAAATFHWDHAERQVRVEGLVVKSPPEESDAYFAQRPWESRLSAWASRQSRPLRDRQQLIDQYHEAIVELGFTPQELLSLRSEARIPRPSYWGGYRLWASRVELWIGGGGRMHDRAVWERTLTPAPDGFTAGVWSATRLQP
jgi:pyridoxamine 5'-phosphate oxidase